MILHKKVSTRLEINVNGENIFTVHEMKALGVIFNENLTWSNHIKKRVNSCKSTLFGLKTIRKYYKKEEFTTLVTSYLYSKLYYCGEVWLNVTINKIDWNRIERINRAAMRLIEQDYEHKIPEEKLYRESNRATPKEWSTYLEAKALFKIMNNQDPEEIYTDILCLSYTEPRHSHRILLFDESKNKMGKNILANRIAQTSRRLKFDWFECNMTDDHFRTNCKNTLFNYAKRS